MSEGTASDVQDIEIAIEDAGTCRKKLVISVAASRVKEELDQAFLDVVKNVQLPGFRRGHLPRSMAEQKFGDAVRSEVRQSLMDKAYHEALDRHDLTPLSNPDLESEELPAVDPEQPFKFEVALEVRPEVTIPELGDIAVDRVAVEISPKDIEDAIDNIRLDRAELRPADDGVVQEKDVLVMDAAVVSNGETVIDAENVQYRHPSDVVAGILVEGIAEKLLGKKTDDVISETITLPSNFKVSELAGEEADLRLTLRDVKRFHLPEVDEEFAKSLDFDSVEELKEEAEKAVRRHKEQDAEKALDQAILDAILAKAPIELPEGLVKKEIGQVLSRYRTELHMQGAPEEVIEERLAEMQGDAADRVAREFRVAFLVDELAAQRSVFVTENEVGEQVAQMAAQYGRPIDQMRTELEGRNLMPSLRSRLRERKVLDALRRDVTING